MSATEGRGAAALAHAMRRMWRGCAARARTGRTARRSGGARLTAIGIAAAAMVAAPVSDPGFEYYVAGDPADARGAPSPGVLLVGGGEDPDAAFRWFLEKAGGGDVVVLNASEHEGYDRYLDELGEVDSVETLVVRSARAAADAFVLERVRSAEALFIGGGDQWDFIRNWKDAPLGRAIQELVDRGVPVGGTSAGSAVLGEFVFTAQRDSVSSSEVLRDPRDARLTLDRGLVGIPLLRGVITDTHFRQRDRMGRTLAFLARMLTDHGLPDARAIALDEATAVLLEPDGSARVAGEGFAYFLRATAPPRELRDGTPLTFGGVAVHRVGAGARFDLGSWSAEGAARYSLSVEHGVVRAGVGDDGR